MNKQLNKLKQEAIRKGAAELVTYTLGDETTDPVFQENSAAYEEFWYDCLDLNAIGFLGEEWFMDEVEELLMEKIRELQYEFVQDVIGAAMDKAVLSLKSLEYDTNLETHEGAE